MLVQEMVGSRAVTPYHRDINKYRMGRLAGLVSYDMCETLESHFRKLAGTVPKTCFEKLADRGLRATKFPLFLGKICCWTVRSELSVRSNDTWRTLSLCEEVCSSSRPLMYRLPMATIRDSRVSLDGPAAKQNTTAEKQSVPVTHVRLLHEGGKNQFGTHHAPAPEAHRGWMHQQTRATPAPTMLSHPSPDQASASRLPRLSPRLRILHLPTP